MKFVSRKKIKMKILRFFSLGAKKNQKAITHLMSWVKSRFPETWNQNSQELIEGPETDAKIK
jgi:hypothetical protein